MLRKLAALAALSVTVAAGAVALATPAAAATPGPVILMGIDAEDGGVGAHGSITTYERVVQEMLNDASKGANNILVLGGGKSATDNVTTFWNQINADMTASVTYANNAAVGTVSFAPYELVVVVSSQFETASGGLTTTENNLLGGRDVDFADHVNSGGGLLGFSQTGFSPLYPYLGNIGSFSVTGGGSDTDITVTADGTAAGLDNTSLDVCCWHDTYVSFPAFLKPLAHYTGTSRVAAIGGASVVVTLPLTMSKTADAPSTNAGGVNGYTIRVSNPNASAFTVTSIRDTLPAGFTYRAGSTTGVTTANPAIAMPTLTWSGSFVVPANGSIALHFNVNVSATPGTYFNSVSGTALNTSVTGVTNTAPINVFLNAVTTSKTADASQSFTGAVNGYTIRLSNANATAVTVTSVRDTLPPGFTYRSGSTTGFTTANPVVTTPDLTWNGSFVVPANGSIALHFNVNVAASAGTYTNSVSGTASGTSVVSALNVAPITVVRRNTSLSVTPAVAAVAASVPPTVTSYLLTMNATLNDISGVAPALSRSGRTITFIVTSPVFGTASCTAVTNSAGTATCPIDVLFEAEVLVGLGYRAFFNGDSTYAASSSPNSNLTNLGI